MCALLDTQGKEAGPIPIFTISDFTSPLKKISSSPHRIKAQPAAISVEMKDDAQLQNTSVVKREYFFLPCIVSPVFLQGFKNNALKTR